MQDNLTTASHADKITYHCYGEAHGRPLFYFHGLPGSHKEARLFEQACREYHVRLIATDRPGYGATKRQSGDRYLNWARSIEQLADELGYQRFYILGVSGGAPYALACASRLKSRVIGTNICCGLATAAVPELRCAMPGYARLAFYMATHYPSLFIISYGLAFSMGARFAARWLIAILGLLNGRPDRTVMATSEVRSVLAETMHVAFAQYWRGAMADLRAALQPWPFDLKVIHNLHIWHGDRDNVVPYLHSEWLHSQVPDSKLHIIPGEGHFSLPIHFAGEVLAALINTET